MRLRPQKGSLDVKSLDPKLVIHCFRQTSWVQLRTRAQSGFRLKRCCARRSRKTVPLQCARKPKGGGHLPEWKKEHLSVAKFHEHQSWWQIQAA